MIDWFKEIMANLRLIPQVLKLLGEIRDELIKYRELIADLLGKVDTVKKQVDDVKSVVNRFKF